jgi:hypothetical protein
MSCFDLQNRVECNTFAFSLCDDAVPKVTGADARSVLVVYTQQSVSFANPFDHFFFHNFFSERR